MPVLSSRTWFLLVLSRKWKDRVVDEAALRKLEPQGIIGENITWYSHYGRQTEGAPEEKHTMSGDSAMPSHIPRVLGLGQAHLHRRQLSSTRGLKQPRGPSVKECGNKCWSVHTGEDKRLIQTIMQINPQAMVSKRNESQDHI